MKVQGSKNLDGGRMGFGLKGGRNWFWYLKSKCKGEKHCNPLGIIFMTNVFGTQTLSFKTNLMNTIPCRHASTKFASKQLKMVYQVPIQCESWVFAGLALDQEFINNAQTCRDSPPPLLEEGKWGQEGKHITKILRTPLECICSSGLLVNNVGGCQKNSLCYSFNRSCQIRSNSSN